MSITPEERRNLSFAFLAGVQFGKHYPIMDKLTEAEVMTTIINRFIQDLPKMIEADELESLT